MANQIKARINSAVEVKHKDIEIIVRNDAGKIGTLLISKGNIQWLPKGNSIKKKSLSWLKFAEMMEEYGKTVRKKI